MKHLMQWIGLCAAALLAPTACSEDEEIVKSLLEPEKESVLFTREGGTQSISVKANIDWSVAVPAEARAWCAAAGDGQTLTVTASENTDAATRSAVLTLSGDGLSAQVEVRQMGTEPTIELEQASVRLEGTETAFAIDVAANVPYTIQISASADWLRLDEDDAELRDAMEVKSIKFILDRNTTGKERTGSVIFASEDKTLSQLLRVTQGASEVEEGDISNVGDLQLPILRATADKENPEHPISMSFDRDATTYYESRGWLPATIVYTLEQPSEMDYLIYRPRSGNNGGWGKTKIEVAQGGSDTYETVFEEYDFSQSDVDQRIDFPEQLKNVSSVRFTVNSRENNKNNYNINIREMEFYQVTNYEEEILAIFTSLLCEELKPGVGQTEIDNMGNSFLKSIAQQLLNGTYDTTYRIQDYEPYRDRAELREEMKCTGYDLFENATGIWFQSNEEALVFLGDEVGDRPVNLVVYDSDGGRRGESVTEATYSLKPGVNRIRVQKGLAYINYSPDDWETAPKARIHIPNGQVNGYFNTTKQTAEQFTDILNNTTYDCIDMVGKYAHWIFPVSALRQYCKDPVVLMNHYDDIVWKEWELMGMVKYGRIPPKNMKHMFARVTASGYFADGKGAGFAESGMGDLANSETCKRSAVWSIAHEWGHNNQIRPDLNWAGTGELTNNFCSVCIRYELTPDNLNLEGEKVWDGQESVYGGRFNSYLNNGIVRGKIWHYQDGQDGAKDHFVQLCPVWQLFLYYRYIKGDEPSAYGKKRDWYADICEMARNSGITSSSEKTMGEFQVQFLQNVCDVLQVDLTDFYIKAGMLRACDTIIDSSSYRVTQQMCDDLVRHASRYEKPETPVLYYLTANSREAYENKLPVQGTYNQGVDRVAWTVNVSHDVWKNVVVFETYNKDDLIYATMVGTTSGDKQAQDLTQTYVRYPKDATAIYAVSWDGKRTLVYGESNGMENKAP